MDETLNGFKIGDRVIVMETYRGAPHSGLHGQPATIRRFDRLDTSLPYFVKPDDEEYPMQWVYEVEKLVSVPLARSGSTLDFDEFVALLERHDATRLMVVELMNFFHKYGVRFTDSKEN